MTNKMHEIAEYLRGTCKSEADAAENFGVDYEEVLEACIEGEIEICDECGWWVDVCEVSPDHEHEIICIECADDHTQTR